MSPVRSAPEIRKRVFFCNFFFSTLHGLTWHLHLIQIRADTQAPCVIFNQAIKQENDKILQSSVNFLSFFVLLWWAPSMIRMMSGPMGEGGWSIPYPVDFWPDYPICHKFSSKINKFPTRYRRKFVLNILYKSHWLIFLTNNYFQSSSRPRDWKRLYLSDRWSWFCLLMAYRAVFDFRFFSLPERSKDGVKSVM